MGEFNAEVFCTKLEANIKSNQHRIDELEKQQSTIQDMLIALNEIATEMKGMKTAQDDMNNRLRDIEKKPGITLDKIMGVIITVVVTSAVTQLLLK